MPNAYKKRLANRKRYEKADDNHVGEMAVMYLSGEIPMSDTIYAFGLRSGGVRVGRIQDGRGDAEAVQGGET